MTNTNKYLDILQKRVDNSKTLDLNNNKIDNVNILSYLATLSVPKHTLWNKHYGKGKLIYINAQVLPWITTYPLLDFDQDITNKFLDYGVQNIVEINFKDLDRHEITRVPINNGIISVIQIDLDTFIQKYVLDIPELNRLDRNRFYSNTLFIFNKYTWYQIVNKFNDADIIITGGNGNKRHLMTTEKFKLSLYLHALGITSEIINNTFFNVDKSIQISHLHNKINNFSRHKKSNRLVHKRDYHSTSVRFNSNNNNNNEFLESIRELIEKSPGQERLIQEKIEREWLDILHKKLNNLEDKIVINSSLRKLYDEGKEMVQINDERGWFKKYYSGLYPNIANPIYLILSLELLIHYFNRVSVTKIASIINDQIVFRIYLEKLKEKEFSGNFDEFLLFSKMDKDENRFKLGLFYIDIFKSLPIEIFQSIYRRNDTGDIIEYLKINLDKVEILKDSFTFSPQSLPMLCMPNKWDINSYGGTLFNVEVKKDIVQGSKHHEHNTNNRELLYDTINILNSRQFGINSELLMYLQTKGKSLLELRDQNKNIETKLFKDWTLKIAELYNGYPFYLNHYTDWRGRIYTDSFYITYQGSELSLALINPWKGKSLTENGIFQLYVYGATCYSNILNKDTKENRYNWIKKNYKKILELDIEFIKKADLPILFASFSLVLKNLHLNPEAIVKLPVYLDATCSGLQHTSALMRDYNVGKNVNLVPGETVADIYSLLIGPINTKLNNMGIKNFENIQLTRKEVKRPIMTTTYRVTNFGIRNQLIENLKSITIYVENNKTLIKKYEVPSKDGLILLDPKEILIIAKVIKDTLFVQFPSLLIIYNYFEKISNLMMKLQLPMNWITPAGLNITQLYKSSVAHKVSFSLNKKSKTVIVRKPTDKVDTRKQRNAIVANFTHSLDASHLMLVINTLHKEYSINILPIHDCFGAHPNDMNIVEFIVKKEFILLYSSPDYLKTFDSRIIQSIIDIKYEVEPDKLNLRPKYVIIPSIKSNLIKRLEIPELPQQGSLDLKDVINSKYMIN